MNRIKVQHLFQLQDLYVSAYIWNLNDSWFLVGNLIADAGGEYNGRDLTRTLF